MVKDCFKIARNKVVSAPSIFFEICAEVSQKRGVIVQRSSLGNSISHVSIVKRPVFDDTGGHFFCGLSSIIIIIEKMSKFPYFIEWKHFPLLRGIFNENWAGYSQTLLIYTKRGLSACSTVLYWPLGERERKWDRDRGRQEQRERERDREKRKWRHDRSTEIGGEFTLSLSPNSHVSFFLSQMVFLIIVAQNWQWAHTFRWVVLLCFASLVWRAIKESKTNDRTHRCTVLPIEKWIKLIPKTIGNRKRDCAWGCSK